MSQAVNKNVGCPSLQDNYRTGPLCFPISQRCSVGDAIIKVIQLYKVMKIRVSIMALVLSCLQQPANAQGNLVVNGGFDHNASGWTMTNVDISEGGGYYISIGNPPGSVFLYNPSFNVFVPTASQEINSLTPGTLYIVSGDYMLRLGKNVTDNSFGVALDSVFLFETTAPADSNWHSFSFDYAATSVSALLRICAQINGTDDAYFIDNIAMYATPEPSAWSLIFLGSGLLIYFRKRHRHSAQARPLA